MKACSGYQVRAVRRTCHAVTLVSTPRHVVPRHAAQGGVGSRAEGTSRGNADSHAGATLPTLAQTMLGHGHVGRKPRRGHAGRALRRTPQASRPHARRGPGRATPGHGEPRQDIARRAGPGLRWGHRACAGPRLGTTSRARPHQGGEGATGPRHAGLRSGRAPHRASTARHWYTGQAAQRAPQQRAERGGPRRAPRSRQGGRPHARGRHGHARRGCEGDASRRAPRGTGRREVEGERGEVTVRTAPSGWAMGRREGELGDVGGRREQGRRAKRRRWVRAGPPGSGDGGKTARAHLWAEEVAARWGGHAELGRGRVPAVG
jgi:hypothetical protein